MKKTPAQSTQERPHPLQSVKLTPEKSPPRGSSLSQEQIEALRQVDRQAHASQAASQAVAEEPEEPEIPQPRLSPEDIGDLSEMQELFALRNSSIALEQNSLVYKDQKLAWDRNKQLEKRLPAIKLADLLFKDTISQAIPISDDYILEFTTIPTELELLISEVSLEYLKKYPEQAKSPSMQQFILQVATLACGLLSVCGKPMYAGKIMDLHTAKGGNEAALKEEIRSALTVLLAKPEAVLQDMMNHQANFTARVRRVINHAGYVNQEMGKS